MKFFIKFVLCYWNFLLNKLLIHSYFVCLFLIYTNKGQNLSVFIEKLLPLVSKNGTISINVNLLQKIRFILSPTFASDVVITCLISCQTII